MFSLKIYHNFLRTKKFGRTCKYIEVLDSTINRAAEEELYTLVVAGQQTKGRGQRDNVWDSPPGCAMASMRIPVEKNSFLGHRLSFLQHMTALAAIKTVEFMDNTLASTCLRLKWPNDIVFRESDEGYSKLGGVLITTSSQNTGYDVTISLGFNILNDKPTTCVKQIINSKFSSPLSIGSFLAEFLNRLESFCDLNEEKFDQIKSNYYERCLQVGKVVDDEIHGLVLVENINDDGFLIGKKCTTGDSCIVTKIKK